MSLILALGTNQGDRETNLNMARKVLSKELSEKFSSHIYESEAVDYLNQPPFLNMVIEYELPDKEPRELMQWLLKVEKDLGRKRDIPKGPRIIDIDILFWGKITSKDPDIVIPHPRWREREFVKKPLSELPFYEILKSDYGNFGDEEFQSLTLFK